jgi:subtilisin-like proprotein convertase family protein
VNQGGQITINDNGAASPYPSTNRVQGTVGILEKVAVTLNGVSHGYPDDMDMILEGPDGTRILLLSDAGGQFDLGNATFTLDGTVSALLPDDTAIVSGAVYRAGDYDGGDQDFFAAPPAGIVTTITAGTFSGLPANLGLFSGKSGDQVNGTWNLFIMDDTGVDSGSIRSWSLDLFLSPILAVDNSETIVLTEDTPKTINLLVTDADTPLNSLTLSATSSNTGLIPNSGLTFGGNTGGTNRTLTITPGSNDFTAPGQTVTITITAKDAQGNVYPGVNEQTITVRVDPVNDAPTMILNASSTTINTGGASTNITVHLRDVDDAATAVTLTATSSNPSVVPATNVLFRVLDSATPGTNRIVQIVGGVVAGSSTITIIATDDDGASTTASINVAVNSIAQIVAANPTPIAVTAPGAGTPFPSTISIPNSGNLGVVGRATVTLVNIEHDRPSDLGVLLVSPSGESVVLMRGVGDSNPVGQRDLNDVRLTFSTTASVDLSSSTLTNGSYVPTDLGSGNFPSPAPVGPYGAGLSALQGSTANGTWSLYVYDTTTGEAGRIAGGWILQIFPAPFINAIATQSTPEDTPITVSFATADFDGVVTNVVASSSAGEISISPVKVGNVNGLTSGSFTFTPAANFNGSTTITLTATDNNNFNGTRNFTLNVTPVNDPPTQSVIPKQIGRAGRSIGPVTFTIGDIETPGGSLTVTATSNNPKLLPPGSIILGGSLGTRTITLFPAGSQAGTADITVSVTDDGRQNTGDAPNSSTRQSSSQVFNVTVEEAANPLFENTTGIQILDAVAPASAAAASPYPSSITVNGLQGTIAEVQVTLYGITHPQPDDIDVLLVGPGSSPVGLVLMSDAGGGAANALNNVTLRFRDSTVASPVAALPDEGQLLSGDYLPSNFTPNPDFPAFSSPGETASAFSSFVGANPNGDWRLYVVDDTAGPRGGVISSWQLSIRTRPVLAAIPDQTTPEDTPLRFTASVGDNQPGVPFVVSYTTVPVGGSPNVVQSIVTAAGTTITPGGATIPGGSQSFTINPVTDVSGTNSITLFITDPSGFSVSRTFNFVVTAVNDAPRFGDIANLSTPAATPNAFEFTVSDPEGTAVTVVGTSSRQDVVPDANIVINPPSSDDYNDADGYLEWRGYHSAHRNRCGWPEVEQIVRSQRHANSRVLQ